MPLLFAAGDRIKVAGDILAFDEFLLADDRFPYDEKPSESIITRATARSCRESSVTAWPLPSRSTRPRSNS
ncbi:MAG: hypothetical protein IT426_16385 [Pirellulales bacterium]|nr:hypothetical protein [Pirellulales bacterium]